MIWRFSNFVGRDTEEERRFSEELGIEEEGDVVSMSCMLRTVSPLDVVVPSLGLKSGVYWLSSCLVAE